MIDAKELIGMRVTEATGESGALRVVFADDDRELELNVDLNLTDEDMDGAWWIEPVAVGSSK